MEINVLADQPGKCLSGIRDLFIQIQGAGRNNLLSGKGEELHQTAVVCSLRLRQQFNQGGWMQWKPHKPGQSHE